MEILQSYRQVGLSNILQFLLQIKAGLLAERSKLKVGDPTEFDSFTSAVIDEKAFQRIKSYIEHANSSTNLTVIGGGKYDNRWVTYYIGKLKECAL
jgi:acyl-CoA reductase-like NAD-dependent aldehyde dehydrogenase